MKWNNNSGAYTNKEEIKNETAWVIGTGPSLRNIDVSTGVYVVMLSDLDTYETKTLKVMIIK